MSAMSAFLAEKNSNFEFLLFFIICKRFIYTSKYLFLYKILIKTIVILFYFFPTLITSFRKIR